MLEDEGLGRQQKVINTDKKIRAHNNNCKETIPPSSNYNRSLGEMSERMVDEGLEEHKYVTEGTRE